METIDRCFGNVICETVEKCREHRFWKDAQALCSSNAVFDNSLNMEIPVSW